ncbi:MAG: DUF2184 domain-containing protein [Methyloprofundus sp.]|nr:DUF2184 domain-containing protein [Methyloprofundus sp.]
MAEFTAFLQRQLEQIKAQNYDVKRAALKGFELMPISSEINPGAETITYRSFDKTGIAKVIAGYADDLPRADVLAKEFTSRVRSVGAAYGYSVQELRAAQFANQNLAGMKRSAAERANDEKLNRVAWYGDTEFGLQGLLSAGTGIPTGTAAANAGGTSTKWVDKTADEIAKDISDAVTSVISTTNGVEQPDSIVLSIDLYREISTRRLGDSGDLTVLEFVQKANPMITRWEWANELTASQRAANGIASFADGVMWVYRYDPTAFTWEIPMMFMEHPFEKRNLEYVIDCESRTGGLIIYYPLSMRIVDGL